MSTDIMTEKFSFFECYTYILWCRQSERGLAKKQQQIPLQRGGGGVSVFECVCSPKTKHHLSCFDSGTFGQVKTLCKGGRSTEEGIR
jgi:hypothetical protein